MKRAKVHKGQMGLFLIFAILIFVAIMAWIWPRSGYLAPSTGDSVGMFVNACLQSSGAKAIQVIGAKGGPQAGSKLATSEVEEAIARQTEKLLDGCYNSFSDLKGMTVSADEPHVSAHISRDALNVEMDQTVTIVTGDNRRKLDRFGAKVLTPLSDVIVVANSVSDVLDVKEVLPRRVNATMLAKDGQGFVIIEFPVGGIDEPVGWWTPIKESKKG